MRVCVCAILAVIFWSRLHTLPLSIAELHSLSTCRDVLASRGPHMETSVIPSVSEHLVHIAKLCTVD